MKVDSSFPSCPHSYQANMCMATRESRARVRLYTPLTVMYIQISTRYGEMTSIAFLDIRYIGARGMRSQSV